MASLQLTANFTAAGISSRRQRQTAAKPSAVTCTCTDFLGSSQQLRRTHVTGAATRRRTPQTVSKMFVPDFGGRSPEGKAAENLHNYFTYLAVRIVLTQLQAYNPEGYEDLRVFTDTYKEGLRDGDKFCAALMRTSPQHKQLALRIMEVRAAYSKEDFEWENMRYLAQRRMDDANRLLMCDFLVETTKLD